MSVFISIATPQAAFLLTDGAAADRNHILRDVVHKVFKPRRGPLAVTYTGDQAHGDRLAAAICNAADELGVERAVANLQSIVDSMRTAIADAEQCHVVVSAFVPGEGGIHRFFATIDQGMRDDDGSRVVVPAWTVRDPDTQVFGDWPSPEEMAAAGIPAPGASLSGWLLKHGGDIMEILRRKSTMKDATGRPVFTIGGMAELTEITAQHTRGAILRTWPDRIGERIDPFSGDTQRRAGHHADNEGTAGNGSRS